MNYYFHVPFCRSKCGYCAFYSEASPGADDIENYLAEIERQLRSLEAPQVAETIYIGGGTPTLLSAEQLERLTGMISSYLPRCGGCEISMEANPESITPEKLSAIRPLVNRLSVGVQSFDPEVRRILGRCCSDAAIGKALEAVSGAGFKHWNIDLIYGVPGEGAGRWESDLRRAGASGADHLSCYALTPEEGARLGGTFEVDDDAAAGVWQEMEEWLGPMGFSRYEISNYARSGGGCRHNMNVWRGGLLRGFGPSASGFDGVDRVTETASLAGWLAGEAPEVDRISAPERLNEIFAVNLRTTAGWTPEMWRQVPGADDWNLRLKKAFAASQRPGTEKFWQLSPERIALSGQGLLFWDLIAEDLLTADE